MLHDGGRASGVRSSGTLKHSRIEWIRETIRSRDGKIEQQAGACSNEQRGSCLDFARE